MGPKLYLQSFCTAKKTISKVKRQTSEWEKIIANETIDNLQNIQAAHEVQYQKNKQPNQKVGRRPKQTFLQRRHRMANKHVKRFSASLIIREMLKITVRYHLTWVRMAITKNLQTVNAGEDVEKREPSCTAGGNVN